MFWNGGSEEKTSTGVQWLAVMCNIKPGFAIASSLLYFSSTAPGAVIVSEGHNCLVTGNFSRAVITTGS